MDLRDRGYGAYKHTIGCLVFEVSKSKSAFDGFFKEANNKCMYVSLKQEVLWVQSFKRYDLFILCSTLETIACLV